MRLPRGAALRPPNLMVKGLGAGLAAGSAGSLVGMGGGFVAIPAMTSRFMNLSQHEAHATSLVSVLFTGAAGGASFALAGSVDYGVAATVAGGYTHSKAIFDATLPAIAVVNEKAKAKAKAPPARRAVAAHHVVEAPWPCCGY